MSEDETAIMQKIIYDQAKDTLVGFSGSSMDHQSEENFIVRVRDDEGRYRNIVSTFKNSLKIEYYYNTTS